MSAKIGDLMHSLRQKYASLPPIMRLHEHYGIKPDMIWSQNFVNRHTAAESMAKNILPNNRPPPEHIKRSIVVQVGAGAGALTRHILMRGAENVLAIEIDRRCKPALDDLQNISGDHLKVVYGNIMELDAKTMLQPFGLTEEDLPETQITMTGILPFNIARPMFERFLSQLNYKQELFQVPQNIEMVLGFQQAMAENIIGKPKHQHRRALAPLAEALCDIKNLIQFHRSVLDPTPKYEIRLVRFRPHSRTPIKGSFREFQRLLNICFYKVDRPIARRLNPLFSMQGKTSNDTIELLKSVGICKLTRARSIPVEKWLKLHETGVAKYIQKIQPE